MSVNLQAFNSRFYFMGLAIIAVTLHHFSYFGTMYWHCGQFAYGWFNNGFVGVDVFLYLSLYGLCHSYNNNTPATYYKRRINRIYPLWFLSYALMLAFFFPELDLGRKVQLFAEHFTGIILRHNETVDIEWYLPALHLIYLAFPLLYWLVQRLKKYVWLEILFYFIATYAASYLVHRFFANIMWRIPLVFLGITTYVHRNDISRLSLVLVSVLIFSVMFRDVRIVYSVLTPIVLLLVSTAQMPLVLKNSLSFIGKYSLEVYLAQMIVTKFVFRDYFIVNEYAMWGLAVPLIASLAFVLHCLSRLFRLQ